MLLPDEPNATDTLGIGEAHEGTAEETGSYFQEAFADHAGLQRVAVGWIDRAKESPLSKPS